MSSPPPSDLHRQQDLYWRQLVQLKVGAEYIRRYRGRIGGLVTALATFRAVASSSAIAGWAIFQTYPMVWGGIIALMQVSEALKSVIPVTKHLQAANDLLHGLDALFIDALFEWEDVFAGRLADEEISNRWHRMRKRQFELEVKCFPAGLAPKPHLLRLAEADAALYFRSVFQQEIADADPVAR